MTIVAPPIVGTSPTLPVRVDPAFAEAVVRRVLSARRSSDPALVAAHAARIEPVYAITDERERAVAFERLAIAEFEELGLADLVRATIEARPAVASRVSVVLLGEARGRRDEGVTWESSGAHLGLRIDPARFDHPDRLGDWARHVLVHAEDTLDPGFGFRPGWIEGSLSRPVQQLVHDLWDVTIDARIDAVRPTDRDATRRRHRARLATQLPWCSDRLIDALLERLWDGPRPTLPQLVTWASDWDVLMTALPEGDADADHRGPHRCPLCRFPGDDIRVPDAPIATLVASEYPDWQPALGLCGRCTDRFRFMDRKGGHR